MRLWRFNLNLLVLLVISNSLPFSTLAEKETFCYFAYGSNLLANRIHINNPTATRISPGKLQDYRLDFNGFTDFWNGSAATIVPTKDSKVYGALWNIDNSDLEHLDKQEGVDVGHYSPLNVTIELPNGRTRICRTYLMVNQPKTLLPTETVPMDRQPSETYWKTLVSGGSESQLPESYVDILKCIQHNGLKSEMMETKLGLGSVSFKCPKYASG